MENIGEGIMSQILSLKETKRKKIQDKPCLKRFDATGMSESRISYTLNSNVAGVMVACSYLENSIKVEEGKQHCCAT